MSIGNIHQLSITITKFLRWPTYKEKWLISLEVLVHELLVLLLWGLW
jgi:hypothetical protein